jgi:hypothetical protein
MHTRTNIIVLSLLLTVRIPKVLAAERRVAELERVSAEAKAKAKAERTNEDIALRAIKVRSAVECMRSI